MRLILSQFSKLEVKIKTISVFDDTLPNRDILKGAWLSVFKYISSNLEDYDCFEQFANSPYSSLADRETLKKEYIPIYHGM